MRRPVNSGAGLKIEEKSLKTSSGVRQYAGALSDGEGGVCSDCELIKESSGFL